MAAIKISKLKVALNSSICLENKINVRTNCFSKRTLHTCMIRPRTQLLLYSKSASAYDLLQDVSSSQQRWISSTAQLSSWIDKVKGAFTGQKTSPEPGAPTSESFTLPKFADELGKARKLGTLKQYIVGRSSEATFADAFEKQEAIIKFLGALDPTGENLQPIQKQEAAKHCKCTIADVENTLAKFTWAKEAQKKIEKLKEEGKPMPKNMAEIQKLMGGSSPMDVARSNLAKSGQISRNALCPCGSNKRYKRCCGKD